MNAHSMDRRTFLKLGSLGVAAAASGTSLAQEAAPHPVALRTLGRTGMKISTVSIGAMTVKEAAVFQAAFDMGVNYVDTARVYLNGNSERLVGEALQGYRDKVFVATKAMHRSVEDMRQSIKESFEALKVDYVDVLQLHNVSTKEDALNPEFRAVLAEVKKEGRARFLGITTHSNEAGVIDAVVDDPEKFFDMILVTYNFKSDPKVKEAIARAAKANIGVIAMKTQAGGYQTKELGDISPHQASLKWVLQDTNVTAAVPAMENLKHLQDNLAVMGMQLALNDIDRDILRRYDAATAKLYCRRCGVCTGSCPSQVDIPTINRSLMYAEGYRNLGLARATYRELDLAKSAAACIDCSVCSAQCAHGLDIGERMGRARALLA